MKVVGKYLEYRYGYSSPRLWRENHYAILVLFENFLRFHLQDKHNASRNFNMSWKEHTQSNAKI